MPTGLILWLTLDMMWKNISRLVLKWLHLIGLMGIGCCAFAQQPISNLQRYMIEGYAQGTTYAITYYATQEMCSKAQADSLFAVIDQSMSLYKPDSKISQFNDPNCSSIQMDAHMAKVLKKSFQINKQSKGIFDITVKPLVSLWGFGPENLTAIPDSATIKETLTYVGMDKLKLRGRKLVKKDNRVSIDLNGIAQGYTVDVVHDFLLKRKVPAFIVEVGGEIKTHGYKPNQELFKVLIQRPAVAREQHNYIVALHNKAVTTSGSYEKFRTVKNYRFSHHMDAKTGYPLKSNIISVTVIADHAMEADGLDNVFMAMQPEDAVAFANTKNKIDIYLLYLDQGLVKEAYSAGFAKYIITD